MDRTEVIAGVAGELYATEKAVDDAIVAYYKSGKINDTYKTWFESPIPPKGLNLMFPMSDELKALIATPTDKAADDKPAEEKKS